MEPKTLLENWLTLRPALFHIYRGEVAPLGRDLTVTTESNNHYAWFMEEGQVEIRRQGQTAIAKKGEWLIVHPGKRSQKFSPDARIISVQFQIKWPDGCNLFEEGLSKVLPSAKYPDLEREARRILNETRDILPSDPERIQRTPLSVNQYFRLQHSGLGFVCKLVEILSELEITPVRAGQVDDRLLHVQRQLDQWPVNRSLEEGWPNLLRGWTRDTLDRRFQKAFQSTPAQYLENRRREYARQLLARSVVPIKEIASNLGFRALADFSSWFKRAHGASPRAYRRAALETTEV